MPNDAPIDRYLASIEAELRQAIATPHSTLAPFYGMMRYHMGWADAGFRPLEAPTGKRLRPLLCLLACQAAGGDPSRALPAAAAIEILHNFSLVHDDIEDNDAVRRHRPTVWSVWGRPQAINLGDGMFALAYLTLGRLPCVGVPSNLAFMATAAFQETCLTLTEGQYLDMSFEDRFEIDLDDYLWMIHAKTAALFSSATRIGALLAGAESTTVATYREYGASLGMAFQIQDDLLGVWGQEEATGKPAGSDITRKKKTLPLVFAVSALRQAGRKDFLARLRAIYAAPSISDEAHAEVLDILESVQARQHCEDRACHYQTMALEHLEKARKAPVANQAGIDALGDTAVALVGRRS